MVTTLRTAAGPQFSAGQMVHFIGGVGTVKSFRPDSGSWTYQVEMEMGPEPEMGRIGYETTVMLSEVDMFLGEQRSFTDWAIAGL
ncbi:MAG: hypothetical protein NW220_18755 [Leptolyngbyaceae cyanobacterium bins.349]|nr:hypothetical protein [Leptolyngbyaceae cyanobacterium bins.349]